MKTIQIRNTLKPASRKSSIESRRVAAISSFLKRSRFYPTLLFALLYLFSQLSFAEPSTASPSPTDTEILNKVEQASIQYFSRFSSKNTGLTRDSSRPGSPASIAATGYAL